MDKIRGLIANGCLIIYEGLKTLLQTNGEFKLIKPVVTPTRQKADIDIGLFSCPEVPFLDDDIPLKDEYIELDNQS